jgi:MoxR-like ATPase
MQNIDIEAINAQIRIDSAFLEDLKRETQKVIVGQEQMIDRLLLGLLTNGHVLLEGLPGLAKTMAIKALSKAINSKFSRIQFTPDLLPADIIGTMIYNPSLNEFTVRKGPIFANFILTDEINRAPAKVQSALLEAMQEKQVTIGNETFFLEEPFLVLATQNPIEQEGTYPLPEAQLDRFMFNVFLTYPSFEEELQVVKNTTANRKVELNKILNADEISFFQQLVRNIPIADNVLEYAVSIAAKTRPGTATASDEVNKFLSWGAGPRASQFLVLGAKCHAAISGKYSPDKEDVQAVAESILRHRIVRNYKAEAEGISTEKIIANLL